VKTSLGIVNVKSENRNLVLVGCDAGVANDWVRMYINMSHVEIRDFM
jgi:hypothetical protein